MARLSIKLALDNGPPAAGAGAAPVPKPSLEEKVKDAILAIDCSGHDARVEWEYIRKVHSRLCEMKQTPRVENLLKIIEVVLSKYGEHRSHG
jgi:hypothetical protein